MAVARAPCGLCTRSVFIIRRVLVGRVSLCACVGVHGISASGFTKSDVTKAACLIWRAPVSPRLSPLVIRPSLCPPALSPIPISQLYYGPGSLPSSPSHQIRMTLIGPPPTPYPPNTYDLRVYSVTPRVGASKVGICPIPLPPLCMALPFRQDTCIPPFLPSSLSLLPPSLLSFVYFLPLLWRT